MSWTDERRQRAFDLWKDGKSASEIAKALGGCTRSAVIGLAHRAGLTHPSRNVPKKPKAPPVERAPHQNNGLRFRTRRPLVLGPGFDPTVKPPTPIVADDEPGSATIHTLNAQVCRWPIGDPREEGFTFCGADKARGPYCEAHGAVAYQPITASQQKAQRAMVKHLARRFS